MSQYMQMDMKTGSILENNNTKEKNFMENKESVTKKDLNEIQQAVDIICKYCEVGICEICPDRVMLQKVSEAYKKENARLIKITAGMTEEFEIFKTDV